MWDVTYVNPEDGARCEAGAPGSPQEGPHLPWG